MKTKRFRLKDVGGEGVVSAVIATLNVKDHDGDVTVKGAFGDQTVPVLPTHNWASVPLGKATIRESGDDVIAEMKFNLESETAREWYSALKFDYENGDPLQEYSYGFDVVEADRGEFKGERVQFLRKLRALEVSPVLLGAGINTRTLDVKGKKAHAEVPGSWEAIQRAIRKAARMEILGEADTYNGYVYVEATFEGSVLVEAYKNWEADAWEEKYFEFDWSLQPDGSVTLSGRSEVELDLVIRAKGMGTPFVDYLEVAATDLIRCQNRGKALAALREKEGRTLSQANRDRLSRLQSLLGEIGTDISKLLEETDVSKDDDEKAAAVDETIISLVGKRAALEKALLGS